MSGSLVKPFAGKPLEVASSQLLVGGVDRNNMVARLA